MGKATKSRKPAKRKSSAFDHLPVNTPMGRGEFEIWLASPGCAPELVARCTTQRIAEVWRQEWEREPLDLRCEVRRGGKVLPAAPELAVDVEDDDFEFAKSPLGLLIADSLDNWQSSEQVIYEVVCNVNPCAGDVVTRHWSAKRAHQALQEMIDRDGVEPGEYVIRERGCTLAPLTKGGAK
jgi:hypothetical protein